MHTRSVCLLCEFIQCVCLCELYVMASLSLPLSCPLPQLSTVWMCHRGDVRTLPADLFMIWLLISFTGTWESASQIGLQAPLCGSLHVCDRERKTQNVLKYAQLCIGECICGLMQVYGCVLACACCNLICVRGHTGFIFHQGWNRDKLCLWQNMFGPVKRWTSWWLPIIGLWLSYRTTVGSHCVMGNS